MFTSLIRRPVPPLLLLSAAFIIHNSYRIHLHRRDSIPLEHYTRTYPLPLTAHLHGVLRARYKTPPFGAHLYAVPAWTLLAVHQIVRRGYTRYTHAAAGRMLVALTVTLAVTAALILANPAYAAAASFRLGSALFALYWLLCLCGLRSSGMHAFWGIQLVSVGFGTALLRVGVFLWLWFWRGTVDVARYERVLGVGMCLSVVLNPVLVWGIWGVRYGANGKVVKVG